MEQIIIDFVYTLTSFVIPLFRSLQNFFMQSFAVQKEILRNLQIAYVPVKNKSTVEIQKYVRSNLLPQVNSYFSTKTSLDIIFVNSASNLQMSPTSMVRLTKNENHEQSEIQIDTFDYDEASEFYEAILNYN